MYIANSLSRPGREGNPREDGLEAAAGVVLQRKICLEDLLFQRVVTNYSLTCWHKTSLMLIDLPKELSKCMSPDLDLPNCSSANDQQAPFPLECIIHYYDFSELRVRAIE